VGYNVSMTRRRLVLIGLVAVLVLIGLGLLWPATAITRENAARIQVGMTLAEVEALLGGPDRIDTTAPVEPDAVDDQEAARPEAVQFQLTLTRLGKSRRAQIGSSLRTWGSDRIAIFVVFDDAQRVADFAFRPLRRAPESPLAALRSLLRL
jgi:hypothetical protein